MAKKTNITTPTQFRLRAETLAEIDAIAASLARESGRIVSRADAVRFAVRQAAKNLEKKPKKTDTTY